jgi:hypothetical protein
VPKPWSYGCHESRAFVRIAKEPNVVVQCVALLRRTQAHLASDFRTETGYP